MNERELTEGEIVMKITQLIGLGEEERKIYESLEKNNSMDNNLLNAYIKHQDGLKLLINYQEVMR